MKLSIIIPSYNMGEKIDQCMDSIFSSTANKEDYEVVVCDSSSDNSMDAWKKWVEKERTLRVIHSQKRIHIGPARNLAVKEAKGDYILCLDVDDKLYDKDVLKKVIDGIDGQKDLYACSYWSRKENTLVKLEPQNYLQLASCPVACWTKIYRRSIYVPFPSYMPEDVLPHFLLLDRATSFGYFDFAVVDYDNTPQNKGAISRTFDWLIQHPTNLLELADSNKLKNLGLREEFVAGVIHNLADMWQCREKITNPEIKKAYKARLCREYRNFMTGLYIH